MEQTTQMQFDTTDLNDGQAKAFDLLREFIDGPLGRMFVLTGYAGTGKSYLTRKLVQYIKRKHPSYGIAVTAPTNKAVKVLYRFSGMVSGAKRTDDAEWRKNIAGKLEFLTIHKLLGLTADITEHGEQVFVRKDTSTCSVNNFKVVIVDETSMLNDDLFHELASYRDRVKIIFIGDPAQIPPVGRPDCIPFRADISQDAVYGFVRYRLTEIMRQSRDNPIISTTLVVRNNVAEVRSIPDAERVDRTDDQGHGVRFIRTSEGAAPLLELFSEFFKSEDFARDPDYVKIIAWRNKTVDKLNEVVRTLLYGRDVARVVIGEKLLANKPIIDMDTDTVMFSTNDEFEVTEFHIRSEFVAQDGDREALPLKYYRATVEYEDMDGETDTQVIDILHEDSKPAYTAALANLKRSAVLAEPEQRKGAWKRYYGFMKRFADVNYNYVLTIHKSQGSTYQNTFVIEDDIDNNPNLVERNRIKYTACSRPSRRLFIISR